MQQTLVRYFNPASKRSELEAFVEEYQFLTNWKTVEYDGWTLPACKTPHYWCGTWRTEGCLNDVEHERLGYGYRIYVKQYQRSCYRAVCEYCYKKWIARQANRATRRIQHYGEKTNRRPIHLLISVNPSQADLQLKELRKRMNRIIEEINMEGAAIIFHPFRFHKSTKQWYYAPHFHLVGFVNERDITRAFGKYGWYVKNLGVRESIFQTMCYLLSHAGVKKKVHTVTWIGSLSYSKLKLEKEPSFTHCPVCSGPFVEVYYDGVHPIAPPDKMYEGLVDSDENWYPIIKMSDAIITASTCH